MSSLTHCFEVFGIHPLEQTEIRKAAKAYRNEGFVAQEANEKAVGDYLKTIEGEHKSVLDQIEKELTQRGLFEEIKPPEAEVTVPKEAVSVVEEPVEKVIPAPKLDLNARQVERLKEEFGLKGKELTNKVIDFARRADMAELTEAEEKIVSRLEEGKNPVNFMEIGKKLRESVPKPEAKVEGLKLYHGTTADFKDFAFMPRKQQGIFGQPPSEGRVVFFSDNPKDAEFFGKWRGEGKPSRIIETRITPEAKIADLSFKDWDKSVKLFESIDKESFDLWDEGGIQVQELLNEPTFIEKLKAKDFDGARFVEAEGHGISTAIINLDVIKKVEGVKPPTRPLAEEKVSPKALPVSEEGVKQPWEMTRGEYVQDVVDKTATKEFSPGVVMPAYDTHKQIVTGRIKRGESVPAEVLADYPKLAKFATGERPVALLSPEEVQRVSDTYSKENSPDKRIVDNPGEIPERILRQIPLDQRSNIKGVYDPTERLTYLVRENIGSEAELKGVIDHEDIKHYAVDTFLGKEATNWFNRVYFKYGRSGLQDIATERGLDLNTQEGRIEAAREKIARTPIDEPGVIKQFWAWLREKLSKIFPDMKISDAEIQRTFKQAQEAMESGEFRARDERIEGLRKQVRNIQAVYAKRAEFATGVGKRFAEEDLVPKVAQIKEGSRATLKSILNFIVPRAGVTRDILDKIMEKKGTQERLISEFVLSKTNQDMKARFVRMNQDELTQFIDRIKTGQSQVTPELNQMAQFVKDLDLEIGSKYRIYRPDMNWLQDHFRVLWETLPRGSEKLITELQGEIRDLRGQPETATRTERIGVLEAQIDWIRNGVGEGTEGWRNWWSRRPLEGSRGYFKQHTLEDMSEGIRFGGVPYSYNPMEMLEMHYGDALKFITSQEMWKGFEEIGARKFVRTGERPPEGFVRLNDRIARVYFKTPAGMVQAGEWFVEEGAGRLLNNYLSRDIIREHPLGRTMMMFKNMTTAMELSMSPFHLMFESIETVASQAGLGMRKIWNQGLIGEGLKDIITAPKAFYDIAKTGGAALKYISNPEEFLNTTQGRDFIRKFPGASELISDLFVGGGKLRMHEDYRIRAIETLKQNMNSKNYIGAALRSIPALNEMMMKPLFETYIPRLKIGLFLKEYSNELLAREADLSSGRLTRPELARNIWDFVENRLGEMNFDNLFWDRTFKTSLQFLVRSVTWKMGNIRAYGRAITNQSQELISALREGRKPLLTQEMAWAWGVLATTAAIASIAQYAYTGKTPEELKDLVYPKIDEEGNRISLPTYMRDLFHVTHAPGRYVWSSLSGWVGRLSDVLQNRDFYGAQIHDPEQNVISQRIDDLIHLVPFPFSFQTFGRMRERGEPFEKAITGFLGATKAPYWIEKSEAQQLATELAGAKIPAGGMTRADRARTDLIKGYAREYQKAQRGGEPVDDILSKVQADVQSGKLTHRDLLRFRQRITHEPLEQSILRLSLKEALRVWEKATDDEKIKIAPYVLRKFRSSTSPEEKEVALPKIQEIARGMK